MPRLYIDLFKAGKKGARWSKHKYIDLLTMPDGSTEYIYPEKEDVVGKTPTGQAILNKPVGQIIKRWVLGGFTGKFFPANLQPRTRDGIMYHYEAVLVSNTVSEEGATSVYETRERGKHERGKLGHVTEPRVARLKREEWMRKFGVPLSKPEGYETIGEPVIWTDAEGTTHTDKWRIYRYRKHAGFMTEHPHPHITGKLGYKTPSWLEAFRLKTSEEAGAASAVTSIAKPGKLAPELPAPKPPAIPRGLTGAKKLRAEQDAKRAVAEELLRREREQSATPPVGEVGIHAVPESDTATKEALGISLEADLDPIIAAKKLQKRLSEEKTHKVAPFPQWMRDKFTNEGELLHELQTRPATTLVTLGIIRPSGMTHKLNATLYKEWFGTILKTVGRAEDAYKVSPLYEAAYAKDEKEGIGAWHPQSHVRIFMKRPHGDLIQEAKVVLWAAAREYHADKTVNSRFDKFAASKMHQAISDKVKGHMHGETTMPLVHEMDEEEAARKQGAQIPMTPQEMHELHEISGPARVTLLGTLNDASLPETYRRLFLARLWLDDVEPGGGSLEVERLRIDRNKEQRAKRREKAEKDAREAGEDYVATAEPLADWRRPFTGKDSVMSLHNTWIDPVTGNEINLKKVSASQQRRILGKWEKHALGVLRTLFSDPEHPGKFSKEGRMVARWLQLEAKVADENRRVYRDREQHPVTAVAFPKDRTDPIARVAVIPQKPVPAPGTPLGVQSRPRPTPRSSLSPAMAFFTDPGTAALTRQLGLTFGDVGMPLKRRGREVVMPAGGVYQQPGISLGSVPQRQIDTATRYHQDLMKYKMLTPKTLTSDISSAKKKASALKHVDVAALHTTALELQAARRALQKHPSPTSATAEKARVAAAEAAHAEQETKVDALQPATVFKYQQALATREGVANYHLIGAQARLAGAQREEQNRITLLKFEQTRRSAVKKAASLPEYDIVKALVAYDYARRRLYHAMAI